jgi:hypothetical protein
MMVSLKLAGLAMLALLLHAGSVRAQVAYNRLTGNYTAGVGATPAYNPYVGTYGGARTGYNAATGAVGERGAAYNPYTGGAERGARGYNPSTGTEGASRSYYNPATGNTTRVQGAYNPYTGRYGVHASVRR